MLFNGIEFLINLGIKLLLVWQWASAENSSLTTKECDFLTLSIPSVTTLPHNRGVCCLFDIRQSWPQAGNLDKRCFLTQKQGHSQTPSQKTDWMAWFIYVTWGTWRNILAVPKQNKAFPMARFCSCFSPNLLALPSLFMTPIWASTLMCFLLRVWRKLPSFYFSASTS